MVEYVAGKGTTALGVIGTILGSIGTVGVLGNNGLNLLGNNSNTTVPYFEAQAACMHDLQCSKEIAAKDAEIAKLNSEKYTDSVGLKLYEYVGGELKSIRAVVEANKDAANASFAQQAVYNATVNGTISTIAGQVTSLQNVVSSITKTVIPSSAICNFGCGCSCITNV